MNNPSTEQQQEEYLAGEGARCPNCGDKYLVEQGMRREGSRIFQSCYCTSCDAEWVACYLLNGFSALQVEWELLT